MAPPMKPSREEMLAVTMNQKLAKQGAKTRKLAEARDVNTMPDPKTYAAVMGMLGTPPNEMGFSVAHPQYKEIMAVAEPAFYAGTAAQIIPAVKPVVKTVGKMAGQALNDRLLSGQSLTPGFNTPAPINFVIKPERGNWLAGNPEKAVSALKSGTIAGETPAQRIPRHEELLKDPLLSAESRASVERHLAQERQRDALDKWVDSNLLNYVKKDMGSPSDTIRLTLDKRRDEIEAKLAKELDRARKVAGRANAEADPRKKANLMRQSQQIADDAYFEEELAASNMFPITGALRGYAPDVGTVNQRVLAGFPEQGMARNPEASAWESLADESIFPTKVKDYLETKEGYGKYLEAKDKYEAAMQEARDRMTEKWIDSGLSPKQAAAATSKMDIFDLDSSLGDTNLKDLTNEMNKYASNTNLIRAQHLKDNPWIEKLNREESIYKTSQGSLLNMNFDHVIDVLREDLTAGRISPEQLNKVSIDQAIRRTQEYDLENARKMIQAKIASREGLPVYKEYPEGYKWYELNRPGDFAAESQAMGHSVRGYEPPYGHADWVEGSGEMGSLGYGHGGWEGIKSGRAKVYSLVDPKGQSHVTVELGKPYLNRGFRGEPNAPTGEEHTRLLEEYVQGQREGTIPSNITAAEYWRQKQGIAEPEMPFEITQIKGKQNEAPNPEYLPFVQDFVTSSGMNVTRDLQNTGLRDISKTPKIQEYLKKKGIDSPRYIPEKKYLEYEDDFLMDQLYPPNQGMKSGGAVKMDKGGDIKATPVKNKQALGMSQALHAAHKFASKPFGYNNPPGEMISEFLGIPATARTLERMGYGEPQTTGKGMTTKPRDDLMDALMSVAPLAPATKGMPVGAVIKNKGGNWLTGDVEKSLDSLLTKGTINNRQIAYGPEFEAARANRIKELRDAASQPGYKGGAEKVAEHLEQDLKDNPRLNETALNKWIQRNLTNYIKKEMATPEDPVRKLAEQGIVHMNIEQAIPSWQYEVTRKNEGFPRGGLGQSQQAKDWENLSDAQFRIRTAKELTDPDAMEDIVPMYRKLQAETNLKSNPWLAKVDPETKIYGTALGDLGFHHIIDVLRQDLASGRIRPDQLSKVSMDQAVRRTYEFDQEMAKKMREAAIKQTEGMPVHKEYPEGYKWIELKANKDLPAEDDGFGNISSPGYGELEQALKYEGDTMGHCVGGYCDDVYEGRSRIYSLRDAKGEPHVTIEVQPQSPSRTQIENAGTQRELGQIANRLLAENPNLNYADADRLAYEQLFGKQPDRIVQIKGKQNAAPKEQYLPFVQDFVKSGKWSDVGDIKNTGLRLTSDAFNTNELQKIKEAGIEVPRYATQEEIKAIGDQVWPGMWGDTNYKRGGEVKMGIGGLLGKGAKAAQAEKARQAMKASEALGQHEGKNIYITQADRTKVGEGFLGGPGFSGLQHTSDPHREAMAAWGVKNTGTANTILGGDMGKNPLFSTMIGSPTQHQSNQMVFDKMYRQFKNEAKKGNLPDELRFMINDKLAKAVDKDGKNIFPADVDILGKNFHKMADTFDRRSIAGHLMGGVGVGGKKGQIIDYDKIIKQTTDPALIDAPSGAIGNRLFTLSGEVIQRPDLHPAFPTIMTGEDMGLVYNPVPRELFMQDFINKVKAEKGRNPGYMDYTRGRPPSQFISEDWLTKLQKEGHKKGGLLKVKRKK